MKCLNWRLLVVWGLCLLGSHSLLAESARRCVNMQELGRLQSYDLIDYSFFSRSPESCDQVFDSYLIFQDLVEQFASAWAEPMDQSCYFMGALDGAYQANETRLLECEGKPLPTDVEQCQQLLDDFFSAPLSESSFNILRLEIIDLPHSGACLDEFNHRMLVKAGLRGEGTWLE